MIVIEGLAMPKSCFDCPVAHPALGNLGAAILGCPLIGKTISAPFCEEKRMDNCPLIPVPEHGDLIDRDALKEQLEYVASLEWNQRVGASPGIECAIDMLDDAQTIIKADGKYIKVSTREECE